MSEIQMPERATRPTEFQPEANRLLNIDLIEEITHDNTRRHILPDNYDTDCDSLWDWSDR